MVSLASFRQMALSFPDAVELPHFHLQSYRIKKKIFATLHEKDNRAMLKLPLEEQSVFCKYDENIFFPVPGAWGKGGATFVDLKKVKKAILKEALEIAYNNAVSKKNSK
jgi:YjbR